MLFYLFGFQASLCSLFLLVWGMARESLTATVAATKAAFQFNQLMKGSFCVLCTGFWWSRHRSANVVLHWVLFVVAVSLYPLNFELQILGFKIDTSLWPQAPNIFKYIKNIKAQWLTVHSQYNEVKDMFIANNVYKIRVNYCLQ